VPYNFPTCAKEGKHMGNTSSGTKLNNINMGVKWNLLLVKDILYKGLSNFGFDSLNTTKEEMR
jgi:hypothetical protein